MDTETLRARARAYIEAETDPKFRAEVEALLASGDAKELEDRFYRDLEFGTGGLRGVIGGGSNRMNLLVVRRATQGLAEYLKSAIPGKPLSAVIAHDSRHYSPEFAEAAALVLAANGVKAYVFPSLRPTPQLSFAVRKLGADTGIVVTASHNPPAYNGYKAYWNDGAQIIAPHDEGIIERVNANPAIKTMEKAEALAKGLFVVLRPDMDDAYVAMVKSKLFRPELIKRLAGEVKVVYTPLHGTGASHFERVMGELGLKVVTVPEQREPDGNFPTVAYPNPEEAPALKLALELGAKEKADVVMATDPDADRLGIAVPDGKGGFALVTGNQLGTLLADYILLSMKELGRLPAKPATIRSVVTTRLQDLVAEKYGATCFECLTGFKWIADLMRRFETDGKGYEFVYGTEESYGYLVENEVRDKDGISAAAMTAEMTLYWRSKGKTLLERLDDLYREFGYHEEKGLNKYFEGPAGMDVMRRIMEGYRKTPPAAFGGIAVTKVRDLLEGYERGLPEGAKSKVELPPSDVLQWTLADGTVVTVRPSGTEPKIKFYVLSRTALEGGNLEAAKSASAEKVGRIIAGLKAAVDAAR